MKRKESHNYSQLKRSLTGWTILIVLLLLLWPGRLQADKFPWQNLTMAAEIHISAELQEFCDPPGCSQARGASTGWVSASLSKSDGFYQGRGFAEVHEEGLLKSATLASYSGPPDKIYEHYCIVMSSGLLAGKFTPGSSFVLRYQGEGLGYDIGYGQNYIILKDQSNNTRWYIAGAKLCQSKSKWLPNEESYAFDLIINNISSSSNTGYLPEFSCLNLKIEYYDKNSRGFELAELSSGIKISMLCGDYGFRVVRINSNNAKYIAGCYYPGGLNNHSLFGRDRTKFLFYNMKPRTEDFIDIVDVYIYDSQNDTVAKIRYTASGSKDARKIMEENLDLENEVFNGGQRWTGAPQDDPEALGSVPLTQQALVAAPSGDNQEVQPKSGPQGSEAEPLGSVQCLETEDGVWHYALRSSSWIKGVVKQGDRLVFRGPGIKAGQVAGDASLLEYGGWQVLSSRRGEVVFEATSTCTGLDPVAGFQIYGLDEAEAGEVDYEINSAFLGNQGKVAGPVPPKARIPVEILLMN